jgi:cytochrome P450
VTKDGEEGSLHRPVTVSDYANPVFNAGPRLCLGRPLAYMEIQLMIVIILTHFDVKASQELSDEYIPTLVSPLKHGVPVRVSARS